MKWNEFIENKEYIFDFFFHSCRFVEWVPESEKRLSEVFRGIQVSHERLNHRTLAYKYIVQVDKLTKSLQRSGYKFI